jgi:transcriptional regulator with XRE-family HTH domain
MLRRNTHQQLTKKALSDPKVKAAYDDMAEEFLLLEEMIKARLSAGKTQEEIAQAMQTTTSVIGRLETGGGKNRHSPTLGTLRNYAKAVGCRLDIKLVPSSKRFSR